MWDAFYLLRGKHFRYFCPFPQENKTIFAENVRMPQGRHVANIVLPFGWILSRKNTVRVYTLPVYKILLRTTDFKDSISLIRKHHRFQVFTTVTRFFSHLPTCSVSRTRRSGSSFSSGFRSSETFSNINSKMLPRETRNPAKVAGIRRDTGNWETK